MKLSEQRPAVTIATKLAPEGEIRPAQVRQALDVHGKAFSVGLGPALQPPKAPWLALTPYGGTQHLFLQQVRGWASAVRLSAVPPPHPK